mmetsp:Transcript_18275/g.36944  ORF Transcript_18275/g.36944 Transcript_18275/m.36944 type:complete len:123 (-) Transcript_18275:572-940(-)
MPQPSRALRAGRDGSTIAARQRMFTLRCRYHGSAAYPGAAITTNSSLDESREERAACLYEPSSYHHSSTALRMVWRRSISTALLLWSTGYLAVLRSYRSVDVHAGLQPYISLRRCACISPRL